MMVRVFTRIKKRNRNIVYIFVNRFIKNGKKDSLYKIFFNVLIKLKRKKKKNIYHILFNILAKIKPVVGLKPKFAAGLVYLIPTFIHSGKEISMGLNWLVKSLKQKKSISFYHKIFSEFNLCLRNRGNTLKYKRDFYSTIITNRDLVYRFSKRKN